MPSLRSALALFAGAVAFVAALVLLVIRLVIPPPPPAAVPVPAPLGPPLTRHLALVIVDGLRFDVATDPALMPALSARMRAHRSAEIWSGVVSMTSSAILTYGTGQRGDVEQIIKNESGSPVVHNDLIKNAQDAGLVTACTGDRGWFKLYPGRWTLQHPDPSGVAIDVDYNAEIFAAARGFLRHDARPNLAVFHFVTPDHQAHAYGVHSERYRAHIRGFDRDLAALLAEIPADTTVLVTSDHGATDTGTHGSDTPLQRRSPLVAWGPGVAPGPGDGRALDQIDLAGTMAALLGVPAPAHGRGHVLVDWLDLDDDRRAAIACADLGRLATFARATGGAGAVRAAGVEAVCAAGSPRARVEGAGAAAAALDRAIGEARVAGRFAWMAPALILAGALALAWAMLRGLAPMLRAGALGLCTLAGAITAVYVIERLPGRLPDPVRATGYILGNLTLLVGVLRHRSAARFLDRRPLLGAALLPGLLVVSETKTTQPECFVVAAVLAAFTLLLGLPRAPGAPPRPGSRPAWPRLALVAALVAALAPLSFRESGFLPRFISSSPSGTLALAIASIAAFALLRRAAERDPAARLPLPALLGLTAVAVASLVLRRSAPAPLCLAGWIGLGVLAPVLHYRGGKRAAVELVALGSYAWVSRDAEIPFLLATYLVAAEVGEALRGERAGEGPIAPSAVLAVVSFLFAWSYVQRVGVQLGLDFVHFDWGAGAFRDPGVSLARVGAAIAYKHGLARAALLAAVLLPLAPRLRLRAVQGLFVAELARAAMLATMLYVCRGSFWTALRALGDVPHALLAVVITAGAHLAVAASARRELAAPAEPRATGPLDAAA